MVAVLLAAGIGSVVLAVLTVCAEASASFKDSLAYDLEVGPLSGKTIWATAAFLLSWAGLGFALRDRQIDLTRWTIVAAVLVGIGLIGTFAPFFQLFTAE